MIYRMHPKKKTSWPYIGLWTLLLVLICPRVDSVNEGGVPEEFKRLEDYRVAISGADGKNLNLRTENRNLELWKSTLGGENHELKAQVAFRAMEENEKEAPREISEIEIDQEIIVRLGSDDTVESAGDHLFNKKTKTNRQKVLLEYDTQSEQFKPVKSKGTDVINVTKNTKVTVVGHGGQREGQVSVGGKTSKELAKVILKLREPSSPIHWSSGLHKIEEISIISCDIGAGKEGEAFAKDFLITLHNAKLSIGSLSVRTTQIVVEEDGSKRTADFHIPDLWRRYIPEHKRKFYLGEDNNLVEVSNTKGRSPEWIESQNIVNELDPLALRNMENNPLYYYENGVLYHIDDKHVGQGIEDTVKTLFDESVPLVQTELLKVHYRTSLNTPMIEKKVQVQVVNGLESLKDNIKYIIQSANKIRKKRLVDKTDILSEAGIQIHNNMNLKETWAALMGLQSRNQQVRHICHNTEEKLKNTVKYFRFKDYIYSINLKDFYVTLYGATDINLINEEFTNIRNQEHVTYETMKGMKNTRSFTDMAQKWVANNQNIGLINPYDGMAVLAMHISEPVRNSKTFIVNCLLWDLESSYGQFRYRNPMTRGDTWSGNHAAIGLNYETADQNMNDQVARETASAMKLWLTRIFRNRYYDYPPKNLPIPREMSSDAAKIHIRGICDNLPLNDPNVDMNRRRQIWRRPNQLSENDQSSLQDLEERGRGKTLETELYLKMVEDIQQLVEKVTDSIKEQMSEDFGKNWKIKSIEKSESGAIAVLENKMDSLETKKIPVPGKIDSLSSEEVLHSYYKDASDPSGYNKINHGLAIYGTLMGFQAANQMFAEGRKWEGGVMVAQGAHGVTELTGINSAVNEYVGNIAQKSISQISAGLEEASAAKFTSALAEAGEVVEAIPVLSAAFTIFNLYEDLKQGTAIGVVDAFLDSTIFITALAGPEMLPVTVALTIVRLLIDPLYNEIKHELDSLPPGASVGDKYVAVIKGIGLALRDVANTFLDIYEQITIPGLIYNIYNLDKEHQKSMDIIHNLQTAENYYKIFDERDGDKCHKKLDFTQGEDSAYGGNLRVELTDHNSMIITFTDPVTSKGFVKEIPFEKDCESVDIVMGIGEAINIEMMQKKATILWFIPVKTEDVISSMTADEKSLHGTYVGNSKPNRFYAVQQNIVTGLSYTLDKYHYELYGKDGNDMFYLGPQKTFVHGGNGQDIYYIPNNAGHTEICNQADDKEMDLLIFNITLPQINARKEKNDLKLFNKNQHEILIKNWFIGEEYRHMAFKCRDGVMFKVGQVRMNGIVPLEPFSLDFSNEGSGVKISLDDPRWQTVVSVVGSNYNDNILGNHLNNVFQAKHGENHLTGRDGKDMYIIQEKKDCDTINNFANDVLIDIVELPGNYADLKVSSVEHQSLKVWDLSGKSCVIMQDWHRGWQWQHVIFKSKDFVVFQITNTSVPNMIPLILDYSDSPKGKVIDLDTIAGNEHIMTVIGSSHYIIQGNDKPNFIQGGKYGGILTGRGGRDTYIIDCKEMDFFIDNYAEDGATDVLYIKGKYSSLTFNNYPEQHLIIGVTEFCSILLYKWFTSENYRHLQIQTEDGITFSIPSGTKPAIFAVDNSRDTLPISSIETSSGIYEGATKIIGPPRCFVINGNSKDNYIDPGTNGGVIFGGEGSDTYVLRKHYEGNYILKNYAADEKVDYLILDINFENIKCERHTGYNFIISAPTVAKWKCNLWLAHLKRNRHLMVKTNDVWFTFSDDLEIQPLLVDERSLVTDLHLDLSSKSLQSVPTVYGSLQKRNFITGNSLNNAIIGGKDTDVLYGLEGDDVLQGSSGKDYLSGGAGDDKIHGGEGNDLILGGGGDDVIYPGQGADTIYGGTGSDTLLFIGDRGNKTGVFINLNVGYGAGSDAEGDLYFGMENVIGTSYDDILIGNDDNNYIRGAGGNDIIQPLNGYDFLQGGEGEDIYNLIDAIGTKMIDNFASDGKRDIIYINHSEKLEIIKQRSRDDLHITIDHKNDEEHKICVKNWFKSEKYKHLTINIMKKEVTDGKETLHVHKQVIL